MTRYQVINKFADDWMTTNLPSTVALSDQQDQGGANKG